MKPNRFYVILVALLVDLLIGDPPNRFHPVAWMGTLINWAAKRAYKRSTLLSLINGGLVVSLGSMFVIGVGLLINKLVVSLKSPWKWFLEGVVLKLTISVRGLHKAANQVYNALITSNIIEARNMLAWHLVSRNTDQLSESQVSAATVESIAENISDGIIAPLFYYGLGGIPSALCYRFINTADSLLGYHDPVHEWLGKIPARTDDIANFLPARLTGLLVVIAAWLNQRNAMRAWKTMLSDAQRTLSPNAGYPMSAMSGALGIALEKEGVYNLGNGFPKTQPADIPGALDVLRSITLISIIISAFFALFMTKQVKRINT